MQKISVYISKANGLKIHKKQHTNFKLGYIFIEKINNIDEMKGGLIYKPTIHFVHELMSYLFLIKKEQFYFSDESLEIINRDIESYTKFYLYKF